MNKNNLLLALIVCAPSVLLSSVTYGVLDLTLVKDTQNNLFLAQNNIEVNECTKYDYSIYNPTAEDLIKYKNDSNVARVIPFYNIAINYEESGKIKQLSIYSVDTKEDLEFTAFAEKRILSKIDYDGNDAIYLDYIAASEKNAKVGDVVSFGNFKFKVARIYNTTDLAHYVLPNYIKTASEKPECTGCYIVCSNKTNFYNETISTMDTRSYIAIDKNTDSLLETVKAEKRNITKNYLISTLIASLLFVISEVVVILILMQQKVVEKERSKNSCLFLKKVFTATSIISALLIVVLYFINNLFRTGNNYIYFGFGALISNSVVMLLIPIVLGLVALVATRLLLKGQKA